MANVITIKLDVTKIEKARLFDGKNGAKYLDLVLLPVRESKYGETHMVKQGVTKEERLAKKQMPILGNAKEMGGAPSNQPAGRYTPQPTPPENLDEDVPF